MPFFGLGYFGFLFSGPVIHGTSGDSANSVGSLIMRVAIPPVVGISAAGITNSLQGCRGDVCPGEKVRLGWWIGLAAGAAFVSALDAGLLAYRPSLASSPAPSTTDARVSVAPFFDPKLHVGGLQLYGGF
jgi:hypothetical protein